MYKLIILLFVPLVCFSQISNQNKYEVLDFDTFKKNIEVFDTPSYFDEIPKYHKMVI